MCPEHASAIDEKDSLAAYPAELLREWKTEQLAAYDRIRQGWAVTDDMAKETLQASTVDQSINLKNSTIVLRSEGGRAPGAGGAGGPAFGPNSRGGNGGAGGNLQSDAAKAMPEGVVIPLAGMPDFEVSEKLESPPGAGGAGGAAFGENSQGGDGGNGGNYYGAQLDMAKLRALGFHHFQVVIGKGGEPGMLPGQHPSAGDSTKLIAIAEDGTTIGEISIDGGAAAEPPGLPDGVREITSGDIEGEFRITTIMPGDIITEYGGRLCILGGSARSILMPELPIEAVLTILYIARWKKLEDQQSVGFFVSLDRPDGTEVARHSVMVPAEAVSDGYRQWIIQLGAAFDTEGAWILRAYSGDFLLAKYEIEIVLAKG